MILLPFLEACTPGTDPFSIPTPAASPTPSPTEPQEPQITQESPITVNLTTPTLAPSPTPREPLITIGLISDVRMERDAGYEYRQTMLTNAVNAFNAWEPDFVVELGNFANGSGTQADYEWELSTAESIYSRLNMPRYYIIGTNLRHYEGYTDWATGTRLFMNNTGMTQEYQSFDVKGFHFIVLTNGGGTFSNEVNRFTWLQNDLASSDLPTIVFTNRPIIDYPGHEIQSEDAVLQAALETDGDVIAVFNGHLRTNAQATINGIDYYTIAHMFWGGGDDPNYTRLHIYPDGSIFLEGFKHQETYGLPPTA